MNLSVKVRREIDDLLAEARKTERPEITYDAIPKWQLLCDLADRHGLKLHGTGDPEIELFVPRQPVDANPFGGQNAVYAASDGIWPMFYAILDRDPPFSLHNAALRIMGDEHISDPYYFFSIEQGALDRRPFRTGTVCLLPGETFVRESEYTLAGRQFSAEQWASSDAVKPIATIRVSPEDFPFLHQIRGHRDDVLFPRIREYPDRFPWVDEQF